MRSRHFGNTSWALGDKTFRLLLSFSINIWVTRYLGPEDFGYFSYAQSLVALFIAFSSLGLEDVVVKALVAKEHNENTLIGTALGLRALGAFGLTAALFVIGLVAIENNLVRMIVLILSISSFFQIVGVFEWKLQASLENKVTALANSAVLMGSAVLKVLMILTNQPVYMFAIALLVESAALAAVLYLACRGRFLKEMRWSFDAAIASKLLRSSWPMIVGGVLVSIYMRIDQVMIMDLLGPELVGQYSAAVKLAEAWYFVPMALSSSLFPAILSAKQEHEFKYNQRLRQLYAALIWISILAALGITVIGDWAVAFLYGERFPETAAVLKIMCWSGVFVSFGVARSRWLVMEGLQAYGLYCLFGGAVLNVVLNLALIPQFMIKGAAIATLASQAAVILFFPLLFSRTRAAVFDFWRALFLRVHLKI